MRHRRGMIVAAAVAGHDYDRAVAFIASKKCHNRERMIHAVSVDCASGWDERGLCGRSRRRIWKYMYSETIGHLRSAIPRIDRFFKQCLPWHRDREGGRIQGEGID